MKKKLACVGGGKREVARDSLLLLPSQTAKMDLDVYCQPRVSLFIVDLHCGGFQSPANVLSWLVEDTRDLIRHSPDTDPSIATHSLFLLHRLQAWTRHWRHSKM